MTQEPVVTQANNVVSALRTRFPDADINCHIGGYLAALICYALQEAVEQATASVNQEDHGTNPHVFKVGDKVSVAGSRYADRTGRIVGIRLEPNYNGSGEEIRYEVGFPLCGGYIEPDIIRCAAVDLTLLEKGDLS